MTFLHTANVFPYIVITFWMDFDMVKNFRNFINYFGGGGTGFVLYDTSSPRTMLSCPDWIVSGTGVYILWVFVQLHAETSSAA